MDGVFAIDRLVCDGQQRYVELQSRNRENPLNYGLVTRYILISLQAADTQRNTAKNLPR